MSSTRTPAPSAAPRRPDPSALVIFGASGDLAARKLVPALYDLFLQQRLPERFLVLGTARREWSEEKFRGEMRRAAAEHSRFQPLPSGSWDSFARLLHYQPLDVSDPAAFSRLGTRLEELCRTHSTANRCLFYLAVSPELYPKIVTGLSQAGLAARGKAGSASRSRIVIEKPFGSDLASATQLNAQLGEIFAEDRIYRIDHYLGKETVQNLAVFRLANGIFEPIWNRRYMDHVQITVAETVGVESRAGFYEGAGALRDMVQNHLLQLLCLVAMEPPVSFEAGPVRQEKLKVLQSVRPFLRAELDRVAVRGQYGPGTIEGRRVPGYREEPGVAADSGTETYVALRLVIENWRWAGVPFYLRTGKRLPRRASEISVQFRDAPLHLFACTAMQPCEPNLLRLRIQPNEGVGLRFIAKTPGLEVIGQSVEMDYAYGESFVAETPSAYETLLLDALEGDPMLFASGDWVEASWRLLAPLLEAWGAHRPREFPSYAAGSWGPAAAEEFLAREGRAWHVR